MDSNTVCLLNLQTMLDTLSPRRLDMLRHVRQHGAGNVRELAQALRALGRIADQRVLDGRVND